MKNSFLRSNRIIYGSLLFLTLLFIYFYGGFVPYTMFHIVLILPVISFIYTFIIYLRFKYTQSLDKKFVTKGEKVVFKYTVANEDFLFYPYIRTTFFTTGSLLLHNKDSVSFSLPPLSKKNYNFNLNTRYRGKYKIGMKAVEIQDFLGLFSLKFNVFEPKEITIYPRIIHLDNFRLEKDFLSEIDSTETSLIEDMINVSDIRKYIYGDSIKKIHWKLTAKYNELMIKNYHSTSETSINLILDLFTDAIYTGDKRAAMEDQIIESILSIANYCIKRFIPVNLVYYQENIRQQLTKNSNEFSSLYKLLAEIKFDSSIDISKVLDIYLRNNINKQNIIIFTSNLSTFLLDILSKASSSGYYVKLILVNDGICYKNNRNIKISKVKDSLINIGVEVYSLGPEDDIKNILETSNFTSIQKFV